MISLSEKYQKIITNNQEDINSGFLLIDKEKDWTSFDVVAKLRGITKIKKIGHAGTLDPFATGLLIVAIGKATRLLQLLLGQNKTYLATMILGQTSNTHDQTGVVVVNDSCRQDITLAEVEETLRKFLGQQLQTPPMFSAKKINGKKLYELARKGLEIERQAKAIEIYKIEVVSYKFPEVKFIVSCSTGTYIRTLAADIGQALGCGALLAELRRTAIAKAEITSAVTLKQVTEDWEKYLLRLDKVNEWVELE